jgi:hypothetical protein
LLQLQCSSPQISQGSLGFFSQTQGICPQTLQDTGGGFGKKIKKWSPESIKKTGITEQPYSRKFKKVKMKKLIFCLCIL